jgi:hypothetical protein
VAVPVASIAIVASALAATGGLAVALLFENSSPKTIAAFGCVTTRGGATAFIPAVTGSPIVDCATWWPSATGGRQSSPPLSAWSAVGKALDAVVEPTAWGPPTIPRVKTGRRASVPVRWEKLPRNWTVDLGVVELTDQLNAITAELFDPPLRCSYASAAVRTVRSLIAADDLSGWRVEVSPFSGRGPLLSGCRPMIANVDGGIRTVQLLQARGGAPNLRHLKPALRNLVAENTVLNRKLVALQSAVSSSLANRCVTVSAAASIWTARAHAAGFQATDVAYWRAVNASTNPTPSRLLYYYTLFKQPASQDTGSCAHVLVMRLGGGDILAYAARIAP